MNQGIQGLGLAALYLAFAVYFLAMIAYWLWLKNKNELIGKIALMLAITGFAANTCTLVIRTIIAHRLPLSNGFEFILTFCWGIVAAYVFAEIRYKLKALGSFVMPIPFLLLSFTIMTMSPQEKLITAIPPVLKSPWLTFHVLTAILAYGAFAVSFGLALMYLLKTRFSSESNPTGILSRFPELDVLDALSYKVIIFAFPLLTLVIITGAIWANYAWGTYWSWDPKETWSLITWIIYAAYLHARLTYGWKGKRAAWLAVLGFAAVLFTFFGVNYLLSGLHSYAK